MKRKLIELGNGCLVVSLPAKYARKHLLNKGDEVQLVEEGSDLRLTKGAATAAKTLSYAFDVGGNARIGRRVLAASYRFGLAELKLTYEDTKVFESLQQTLLEQTIGFEVVKQEERSCLVKDLSKVAPEEFENVVQRCWSLLIDIANDTILGMRKRDYELLKTMHLKDRAVNKFTNYTMRLLLVGGRFSLLKTVAYYHFLHSFEELADEYQDMATYLSERKIEPSKGHIADLEELSSHTRSFMNAHNSFDSAEAETAVNAVVAVQERLHLAKAKDDAVTAYYILSICRRLRNLMIAIVELHLAEELGGKTPS